LYAVVEKMRSVELQRATNVVREAEQAVEVQRAIVRAEGLGGREALMTGDREGRALAETQREMAVWRGKRLEEIRLKREDLREVARESYATSRLKSEQMNSLMESVAEHIQKDEGRRFQARIDDQFLSRKLWMGTREEMQQ
jgi:hypothetical protein